MDRNLQSLSKIPLSEREKNNSSTLQRGNCLIKKIAIKLHGLGLLCYFKVNFSKIPKLFSTSSDGFKIAIALYIILEIIYIL